MAKWKPIPSMEGVEVPGWQYMSGIFREAFDSSPIKDDSGYPDWGGELDGDA